jgi:hypothetical protein
MASTFIPGTELARLFYVEQVRPLLDDYFPGLPYSAALIGAGSEVLGFDSPRSTDHDWGPRLQLFLPDRDAGAGKPAAVSAMLAERLPPEFLGYPTVFAASGAAPETASHWVEVAGLRDWLAGRVGFDPLRPTEHGPAGGAGPADRVQGSSVRLSDWLSAPTQVLAEVTAGAVFHDGLARVPGCGGGLSAARAALAWYPRDVWLYVLACQWQRIDQEEPFPGRCAEAGDDLGSALITARLARDLVRLVLLMQRRYPPYSKWLGTAFARCPAAADLQPLLTGAVAATSWPDRERCLCAAYEAAARLHNDLGLTAYVDPAIRPTFYDRPYRVLGAARFTRALRDAIADDAVRELALIGAVDQFIDSTDALSDHKLLRAAARVVSAG